MATSRSPSTSTSPAPATSVFVAATLSASPSLEPELEPEPEPDSAVVDRVSAAFQRLTESAAILNSVSDELGKPITAIEVALKRLNLGVSTWVECAGDMDHGTGEFWHRGLGYAKVSGKWGIAIRFREGNVGDDEPRHQESWPFNDAPRAFRLEAADRLPELIEQLVVTANETAEQLKKKIDGVREVAHTVARVSTANAAQRK